MRRKVTSLPLIVVVSAVILFYPSPAHAYIDPATGSALLQGVLASLAALVVIGKLCWYRALRFLGLASGQTRTGKAAGGVGRTGGRKRRVSAPMRSHQHTATFGWYGVPALVVLVLGWLSADVTADGASRQPHTSEAYTLAGTTMRLGWRDGRADPIQWDVHVPGVVGDTWISMLAPADSGLESRHLRLHGRLGGRPLEGAGEWRLLPTQSPPRRWPFN